MSTCQILDAETIRQRCESIRSRWDTKTAAERRVNALSLQHELAQQLGLGFIAAENPDERLRSSLAGAA